MDEDRSIQAWAAIATVVAVVGTYFAGPVLRFVPGGLLAGLGLMLAFGASSIWGIIIERRKPTRAHYFSMVVAVVAFVGLTAAVFWGAIRSDVNDTRCEHIQREMLLPAPRRSDLPDIYTALGCRPQGTDDVQFPRKTTSKTEN